MANHSELKLALAATAVVTAVAAAGVAQAQTTGTRLPTHVTVVDEVIVVGAIDGGGQTARGEEPADAAIAELPAVYEDAAPVATTTAGK
jgi:hypothetical protein